MSKQPYKAFLGMQMSPETLLNFRWDFTAAALFSFFNVVFNQFYVPIAIRHGASEFNVGILTAAPAIGLLFSPLWAYLSEKGRVKPFVIYPNLVGRMLIVIPALFVHPMVFVVVALCYHLMMGIQAPTYAAMMTKIYPADIRGRLMGNVRVAMGVLMIPLAYVTGQWIDHSGSSFPLITGAVTGVISILAFARIPVPNDGPSGNVPGTRRPSFTGLLQPLRGNRALVIFLAATTLAGFGNMLGVPLYNIIQVDRLQLSNVEIGYIRMVYFICLLLSYVLMGWIIDRYNPKRALSYGIFAFVLVPVLYGVFGSYPAVLLAGGLQGFGDAAWELSCMAYVFRVAPGREGAVFGLHLMLFGIRGTIGPLLSTSLSQTVSFDLILLASGICGLAGFLLFETAKLDKPEPNHAQ